MSSENEIRNIKLFEEEIRNIKQMAFDAAHPIGETYVQYPQQDDPMTIYNKNGVTSVWEEQLQYNGAFFRSSNALSTVWKVDDEDGYYTINGNTVTPVKVVAENGGSVSIGSATANPPRTIDGKTYKEYSVNGYSNAAAGYINKMNPLSIQGSQNLSHNHGWTTSQPLTTDNSNWRTGTGGMSANDFGSVAVNEDYWNYNGGVTGCFGRDGSGSWGDSWAIRGNHSNNYSYRLYISINHSHDMNHIHRINSDGGNESRPDNYTIRIYKRIS